MLEKMKNFLTETLGHEAGRQEAIGRFGQGMALDSDGKPLHPAGPRMSKEEVFNSPGVQAQAEARTQSITASSLFGLLKSSATSDDSLGLSARKGPRP